MKLRYKTWKLCWLLFYWFSWAFVNNLFCLHVMIPDMFTSLSLCLSLPPLRSKFFNLCKCIHYKWGMTLKNDVLFDSFCVSMLRFSHSFVFIILKPQFLDRFSVRISIFRFVYKVSVAGNSTIFGRSAVNRFFFKLFWFSWKTSGKYRRNRKIKL